MLPRLLFLLAALVFASACSSDDLPAPLPETTSPDPHVTPGETPPDPTAGVTTVLDGVTFPWGIFDGSVPDVPPAAAPGRTFYVDAAAGNDANDGASFGAAKKTFAAGLGLLKGGDTLLLGGGIYRERPSFENLRATPTTRITIGSYGHGTGAPILDGGIKPNTWTKYTAQGQTTVWQSSTAGMKEITTDTPVLGVYVNDGKGGESALRELIHGQVTKFLSEPLPPNQTQADIKDNSSDFYFDPAANVLYADFGVTLGSGDPNQSDVSILFSSLKSRKPLITLSKGGGHGYLSFIGLTIRAGSWHGVFAQTSGNTFDRCDVKFNGGGGIAFDYGGSDLDVSENSVTRTRIWMNVLANWPRFNNAFTGGGWPGGLGWHGQSNALSAGNLIYGNGGEGLGFYGTHENAGSVHVGTNNVARHNVVWDNFSVNIYIDNIQGVTVERNFAFDHPRDDTQTFANLLTVSKGYRNDFAKRLTPVNISLADEPGSAYDGHAHLSDITVVNNVFAGAPFGFIDYDDGTKVEFHGLKKCVIANNTFIMSDFPVPDRSTFGWRHLYEGGNADTSDGSFLQNNIFAVLTGDSNFIEARSTAGAGITLDNNLYSGGGKWGSGIERRDFAAWKGEHSTWDQHSIAGDAALDDPAEFVQPASKKRVYDWSKARPRAGSPAFGAGADETARFKNDFTGAARKEGTFDIGALAPPP